MAGDDVGMAEQRQKEGLVRPTAVDDHPRLRKGPGQASPGFLPVVTPSEDLGDHGVVVRRDLIPLGDAGVDPDARAGRRAKPTDVAGGRRELAVGVFGVQAGLDGMTGCGRRVAGDALAASDRDLELDQVEAGRELGHGVLDLETGVHLHEVEST